jgi:predicted transcriptional regulator
MTFIHKILGSIGYAVNKTLENSLQGTINNMVKKKGFLLSNGAGDYTLTKKGYERLKEIRENYNPQQKKAIGITGKAIMAIESLPKEIREKVMKDFLK